MGEIQNQSMKPKVHKKNRMSKGLEGRAET